LSLVASVKNMVLNKLNRSRHHELFTTKNLKKM
jgi:hypothetical protein